MIDHLFMGNKSFSINQIELKKITQHFYEQLDFVQRSQGVRRAERVLPTQTLSPFRLPREISNCRL